MKSATSGDQSHVNPMARSIARPTAVAAFLLLAVTIFGFSLGALRATTGQGGLIVEAEDLDLGTRWAQKGLVWTLPVRNASRDDITVTAIWASCNCTAIEPQAFVIRAGETAPLKLKLDLMPRAGHVQQNEWDFSTTIYVRTNFEPPASGGWEVRGRIRRPFMLWPAVLRFETPILRGGDPASVQARIEPVSPLDRIDVIDSPAGLIATVAREKEGLVLYVSSTPELRPGLFKEHILLQSVTKAGETLHPLEVLIVGEVVEDVYAIPSLVDFGTPVQRELCEETLILQSHAGTAFSIDSVHADPNLDVQFNASAVGNAHSLRVRTRYAAPGAQAGSIAIDLRKGNGTPQHVVIPVTAYVLKSDEPLNPKDAISERMCK